MKRYQIALIFTIVSFVVYFAFSHKDYQHLNYFTPLAQSFLDGRVDIESKPYLNELVENNGKYYVVYPPAPAIVALPFVILFGEDINQALISVIVAAIAVGLFYLLMTDYFKQVWLQLTLTIVFAFGTNFFFTSLIGYSWYFAHICAVAFLIGALIAANRNKPFFAGVLFSLVFLSRLPVLLAIFTLIWILISKNKRNFKPLLIFALPVISAIIIYGLYNFSRFGSFTQSGYSLIPGVLEEPWYSEGIFSLSYIPRQIQMLFLGAPQFSPRPLYLVPQNIGMSLWLTTPFLMLVFLARREKQFFVYIISALLISIPSLLHGTVGFTQFGYRFSLDYLVFLLLAIGFVLSKTKLNKNIIYVLAILSVLVNLYAVILYSLGIFRV